MRGLASRSLMFAASSVWVALMLVVLVFRGGLAIPVEPETPPAPATFDLAAQAQALVEVGDYEGAWRLYHQALEASPEDVSLWYALGVTLSRLDRRAETEEAFRYVVAHGRPDSQEVQAARQWLVSAGVLAPEVAFTVAAEPVDIRGDRASLTGKATWGRTEVGRGPLRAQLMLQGLTGAAEGQRFHARATLGETYRFERLPAGTYRLIGGAAGQRLWDLTVSVEDGKQTTLNLGRENGLSDSIALYQ